MIHDIRIFIDDFGSGILFLFETLQTMLTKKCRLKDVVDQIWSITMASMPIVLSAGFFVGAIMSVQFAVQMKQFGAMGYLGGLATSGTIREVGPLLIAFMLSSKIGAYTSAELGTMRVTEQIDAIRCLGADPIQEIILPRFLGIIYSSFLLLGFGLLTSVLGGILLGYLYGGVNPEEYIRHIPTLLAIPSVLSGLFKCFIFAFVLAAICTFKGYTTTGGAKGVGRAVVMTSVASMMSIVVADWITSLLSETILHLLKGF